MARGPRVAYLLGAITVAVLAASVWLGRESIAGWWRYLTVRKLLDPAQRDAVLREIVGWKRFRGDDEYFPRYRDVDEVLVRVIECPQPRRLPMYALVFGDRHDSVNVDGLHHFELVDFDGTLLQARDGNNVHRCDFQDINGDGILDWADSDTCGFGEEMELGPHLQVFTLVSLTPEQPFHLCVVVHPDNWAWEVQRTAATQGARIVFGPRNTTTQRVTEQAVYAWNPLQDAYVGPSGGLDQDFVRIRIDPSTGPDYEELERFAIQKGWRSRVWTEE
ncbi:MAG TPA: hypothetical protein VML54_04640 [Candidatus Limnocylindrales bacterium]|nr:hypothetical protein [Candidatus Limnocylindrales bacterium]